LTIHQNIDKICRAERAVLKLIIEAERIKHQQTRDDFAASLGVSRRTVQNWQNGTTEMPLSKLVALATRWGLSIDYLLGLDQQEQ